MGWNWDGVLMDTWNSKIWCFQPIYEIPRTELNAHEEFWHKEEENSGQQIVGKKTVNEILKEIILDRIIIFSPCYWKMLSTTTCWLLTNNINLLAIH